MADFVNQTGDPVFDGTLRQGLSAQLEQSPFLNLLSDQSTAQTLSLMGQPKDVRLTPEEAREVCQRTASAAVLDGSIAQIGTPREIYFAPKSRFVAEFIGDVYKRQVLEIAFLLQPEPVS